MKQQYEYTLHRPGIVDFTHRGEPIGETPTREFFFAESASEARTIAAAKYKESGLGRAGHFNVSLAGAD